MQRKTFAVGGVVLLVLAAVGYLGAPLFLPEQSTVVDESDGNVSDATVLARGEFVGKAGHAVSGSVEIREDDAGYYLYFQNYSQTQGPDVYLYLTPDPDPDTSSQVGAGIKVLVDGGADGGEITKEGTFTQRLPDDFDPAAYQGVAIWCDRFATPFGSATLNATEA